jgi:hypothetical protein
MSSLIYIYTLRWTGRAERKLCNLLQFKLVDRDWLFEHASHRVSGSHLCDVICPTEAGKLFASRKGFMTNAPFMAGKL